MAGWGDAPSVILFLVLSRETRKEHVENLAKGKESMSAKFLVSYSFGLVLLAVYVS